MADGYSIEERKGSSTVLQVNIYAFQGLSPVLLARKISFKNHDFQTVFDYFKEKYLATIIPIFPEAVLPETINYCEGIFNNNSHKISRSEFEAKHKIIWSESPVKEKDLKLWTSKATMSANEQKIFQKHLNDPADNFVIGFINDEVGNVTFANRNLLSCN